jgi:hypothetical protein
MRRAVLVVAACVLGAGAARAADREFSDVVRALSEEWQVKPRSIPLFGLVNLVTGTVKPGGAKHIEMVTFENVRGASKGVREAVGGSWKPFVEVHSLIERKTVVVYAHEAGRDWKLLLVTLDGSEATVIELLLDVDALARWVEDPENSAWHWSSHE